MEKQIFNYIIFFFVISNTMFTFAVMELYFTGVIIAFSTFIVIGLCHPLVIKIEYYTGTRYWWTFLLFGIICIMAALFTENVIFSSLFGVIGASLLWGIGELFEQKKRVKKGWFPMNPKRAHEYRDADIESELFIRDENHKSI